MKFNRGVAIGSSLILFVSACGGSSSSSRERNATMGGEACYTAEEFPKLKQDAAILWTGYNDTLGAIETALLQADTDYGLYQAAKVHSPELLELEKTVFDLIDEIARAKVERDAVNQSVLEVIETESQIIDSSTSSDTEKSKASTRIFIAQNKGTSASVKVWKLEEKLEKATTPKNAALQAWGDALTLANKKSIASTNVYNDLVKKAERQKSEYYSFTSIKRCVVFSGGDAEIAAEKTTVPPSTKPAFQFEDTSTETTSDVEAQATVASSTAPAPSSSSSSSSSSSTSTSTSTSTVEVNSTVKKAESTPTLRELLDQTIVPISGDDVNLRPVPNLWTETTSVTSPTAPPIPTVTISQGTYVKVDAYFSNPSVAQSGNVIPSVVVSEYGTSVIGGSVTFNFPASQETAGGGVIYETSPGSLSMPVSGSGLQPLSVVSFYGSVRTASLGNFRTNSRGVVAGNLSLPANTQSGPFKIVAFGTNAKNETIVVPFTAQVKVPKITGVVTTTTAEVSAVNTIVADSDTTISASESQDSGSSSTSFPWWIVLVLAGLLTIFVMALRRRMSAKAKSTVV